MEESNLKTREELRMKRKRGVIPRRVWNALVDAVYSGMVTSVVGGRVSRNRGGTVIELARGVRRGGGGGPLQFTLSAGKDEDGNPVVLVSPGQIDGAYADGYDAATSIELDTTGAQKVWAQLTISTVDGSVTARDVVAASSDPTAAASGIFALELGQYEITLGEVVSVSNSNYGPVFKVLAGGVDDKWQAFLV